MEFNSIDTAAAFQSVAGGNITLNKTTGKYECSANAKEAFLNNAIPLGVGIVGGTGIRLIRDVLKKSKKTQATQDPASSPAAN